MVLKWNYKAFEEVVGKLPDVDALLLQRLNI